MGSKTCGVCHGTGGHYATERVPNPAGGMFQMIQVRRTCAMCGGSGSVYAPDPPGAGAIRVQGRAGPARPPTPPPATRGKDTAFPSPAGLPRAALLGFLALFRDLEAETWVKWLITLGGGWLTYKVFNRYRRLTRFLRVATGIAILVVVVYFVIRFFSS